MPPLREQNERGDRIGVSAALRFLSVLILASWVLLAGNASLAQSGGLVVEGIQDFQVLPYKEYWASISFAVNVRGSVSAELTAAEDGRIVRTQSWEAAADSAGASPAERRGSPLPGPGPLRRLMLEKLPIGGPYTLRIASGDDVAIFQNLLVGEIWVVGGGDNAIGAPARRNPRSIPQVHFLRDGRWQEGAPPLFETLQDVPAGEAADDKTRVSPWFYGARHYYQYHGIPVGLMGWAEPGAPMERFWDRAGAEMPRFKKLVETHGVGAAVFGWYQGEADAHPLGIASYAERLKAAAAVLRRYAQNPEMTVVVAQLSCLPVADGRPPTPYFGRIRDIQRRFCEEDARAIVVPTMHYSHRDALCLDGSGVEDLGRSIGEALILAKTSGQPAWPGPRAAKAQFTDETRRRVVVVFDNAKQLVASSGGAASRDWLVTDGKHLGYPGASYPATGGATMTLEVTGAEIAAVQTSKDGRRLHVTLKNTGCIRVMSVSVHGERDFLLDLAEPALPGAMLSYATMSDSRGSLRNREGLYCPAFADMPIEEPPREK